MIIGLVPNVVFAQSANHMTKVITVGENTSLASNNTKTTPPALVIELKDSFNTGDRFYLNLENAKWAGEVVPVAPEGIKIETKQVTERELEVCLTEGALQKGERLQIPMSVEVEKGQAAVAIDSNNTTVTSEKLTFAQTSNEKAKVVAASPSKVLGQGKMAEIVIEEAYEGQFSANIAGGKQPTVTIRLEQEGYEWDQESLKDEAAVKLVGMKGFEGINLGKEAFEVIHPTELKITLPQEIESKTGKGSFKIEGVEIKRADQQVPLGVVKGTVEGDLVNTTSLPLIDAVDYEVKITVPEKKELFSGTEAEVSFKLEENIEGALLKERALDITFNQGVTLPLNEEGKVEVSINNETYALPPIEEDNKCIGFEIPKFDDKLRDELNYEFKVKLQADLNVKGDVTVTLEGRALPQTLQAEVMEVIPRIEMKVEPFAVKSGKQEQIGGSITLTEAKSGALQAGEILFIQLEAEGMRMTQVPMIEIVKGDIKLGEPKQVPGGIQIPVERKSTEPSEIQIKHFEFSVSGAVADGYYPLVVKGQALSSLEEDDLHYDEFIMVNVGPKNRREIKFRLGDEAYSVNGKYHHLDVPAYLENGRVMVPLKYVTEALGIPNEKVKWNKETQEITLYANKVIELEIGSDIMKVDGEKVYMAIPAQLVKGRTMVPIGEIARALDLEVDWNGKLNIATFVSK